jgi:hypothetical protein
MRVKDVAFGSKHFSGLDHTTKGRRNTQYAYFSVPGGHTTLSSSNPDTRSVTCGRFRVLAQDVGVEVTINIL